MAENHADEIIERMINRIAALQKELVDSKRDIERLRVLFGTKVIERVPSSDRFSRGRKTEHIPTVLRERGPQTPDEMHDVLKDGGMVLPVNRKVAVGNIKNALTRGVKKGRWIQRGDFYSLKD